jgi:hypothetical protein
MKPTIPSKIIIDFPESSQRPARFLRGVITRRILSEQIAIQRSIQEGTLSTGYCTSLKPEQPKLRRPSKI